MQVGILLSPGYCGTNASHFITDVADIEGGKPQENLSKQTANSSKMDTVTPKNSSSGGISQYHASLSIMGLKSTHCENCPKVSLILRVCNQRSEGTFSK
jgi:hypothetical protein